MAKLTGVKLLHKRNTYADWAGKTLLQGELGIDLTNQVVYVATADGATINPLKDVITLAKTAASGNYVTSTELTEQLKNYVTTSAFQEFINGLNSEITGDGTYVDVTVTQSAGKVTTVTVDDSAITTTLAGYKTKQTAVADPAVNGNATEFIASITQNANGEITVTKKKITASDLGLESAMHFVGAFTQAPATGKNGDVYLNTATKKEYVYSDGWVELGDEGSHALKSITVTGTDGLTGGGDLSQNREISIAESGVATKHIADKAVELGKLSDDVQTSLGKANTALQSSDITGKANKVSNPATDAIAGLSSDGDLIDSGITKTQINTGISNALAAKNAIEDPTTGLAAAHTKAGEALTVAQGKQDPVVAGEGIAVGTDKKTISLAKVYDTAPSLNGAKFFGAIEIDAYGRITNYIAIDTLDGNDA